MNKGKYVNKVFTAIPINKPTSETIRYTVKIKENNNEEINWNT